MNIYGLAGKLFPDSRFKTHLRSFVFSNLYYKLRCGTNEVPLKDGITGKFQNLILHPKECYTCELTGYEKHRTIQEGDVVVDGGAYSGHFTVYAAKKVGPKGKVIAFEADPIIFRVLQENIRLNGLDNVVLVNKGIWSSEGELKFDSRGNMSQIVLGKREDRVINTVATTSLDITLAQLGIRSVQHIKMDIEGAEIEAVKGCKTLMAQPDVHFAIASYHFLDGVQTCKLLEPMFAELGYEAVTEYPKHLTTYAWKK